MKIPTPFLWMLILITMLPVHLAAATPVETEVLGLTVDANALFKGSVPGSAPQAGQIQFGGGNAIFAASAGPAGVFNGALRTWGAVNQCPLAAWQGGGGGEPATTGNAQTPAAHAARFGVGMSVLDVGMRTNGSVWLQAASKDALGSAFPMCLQPVAGSLLVGPTDPGGGGLIRVGAPANQCPVATWQGGGGGEPAASGNVQTPAAHAARFGVGVAVLDVGMRTNGAVWFQASSKDALGSSFPMCLQPVGGSVLVGPTDPGGAGVLRVGGGANFGGVVCAKEIKVTTTGADYVFEQGYALLPLQDLEAFVAREHHLPNIMPASEMQQKGMPVSDVVTAQLAKIEEMTLYMIALKKENMALEARLQALERSVAANAGR